MELMDEVWDIDSEFEDGFQHGLYHKHMDQNIKTLGIALLPYLLRLKIIFIKRKLMLVLKYLFLYVVGQSSQLRLCSKIIGGMMGIEKRIGNIMYQVFINRFMQIKNKPN